MSEEGVWWKGWCVVCLYVCMCVCRRVGGSVGGLLMLLTTAQLISLVSTVIIVITDVLQRNALAVPTFKLIRSTGHVSGSHTWKQKRKSWWPITEISAAWKHVGNIGPDLWSDSVTCQCLTEKSQPTINKMTFQKIVHQLQHRKIFIWHIFFCRFIICRSYDVCSCRTGVFKCLPARDPFNCRKIPWTVSVQIYLMNILQLFKY